MTPMRRTRKHVPYRASYTLAFLDKILEQSGHGVVREEDFSALSSGGIPRGAALPRRSRSIPRPHQAPYQ